VDGRRRDRRRQDQAGLDAERESDVLLAIGVVRRERAPMVEPARKVASDTSGATTGRPSVPVMPKPSSTMLPVMFAVNTRPRPR
jgi:hypothetical protein